MLRPARHLALAVTLLVAACSDNPTSTYDSGTAADGPATTDTGGKLDTGGQTDTGGTLDTGGKLDTGGQTDTGGKLDTGGQADTGGTLDAGPTTCNPNFGQAQACGGPLSGTKWTYTTGCVSSAALDDLKAACPTVAVSNVAYSMTPNSTLQFFAGGNLLRVFSGKITGKAVFPASCVKLGCPALQTGLALALLKYPGSQVTCAAATGGGCSCDTSINLFAFGGGQYVTNSAGVVTVTVAATQYPYHYCVKGNSLTYAGTASNPTDKNVTYVLTLTP